MKKNTHTDKAGAGQNSATTPASLLCDLPNSEFELGGEFDALAREVGGSSGRQVANDGNMWSMTAEKAFQVLRDQIASETAPAQVAPKEHTPGPWTCRQWGGTISIDATECAGIAFVNPIGKNEVIPRALDRANARLIAAAPDLLSAARRIAANPDLSRNDWSEETMNDLRALLAAIAKATGAKL